MLTVHRSETATGLVGALAEVLSIIPSDPLTPEVISVPTRGIERWLRQELAMLTRSGNSASGISANIQFPPPRQLIGEALAAVRGDDPGSDPWSSRQMVWPVLSVLDEYLDESWMTVPAWFVTGGSGIPKPGRRTMAATKIARLFARYDAELPALVRNWAGGTDVGPDDRPLGPAHDWQPRFWRRLRDVIGLPSLAETLDGLIADIGANPERLDLPERVCFYGLTAMPSGHLEVIATVARHRDVHLFVLHPSDAWWLETNKQLADESPVEALRSRSPAHSASNRLLGSWGRDVSELQILLSRMTTDRHVKHTDPLPTGDSILRMLQRRIRGNIGSEPPPGADRKVLARHDVSVALHSCHGPARQVEVARDAILHALVDDPTLEPRDIVIMCPDVETYAPLIDAAFHPDRPGNRGIPDIRIRTADRAAVRENPLAALAMHLLELVEGRATAGSVVELINLDPVRRRFRLDESLIVELSKMIDEAAISWGIDAAHRAGFGLIDRSERTWEDGIERLLTGVFASDRTVGAIGGLTPVTGLEGGDLDLAGRLAELVNRLSWFQRRAAEPLPALKWKTLLIDAVDLLGDLEWGLEWQRIDLHRDLEDLFAGAPTAASLLGISEVRALLAPLTATRPSSVNHRTGDLTVCTLMPMRSVPHRVICLLGMDDERFPRNPARDGDDLLAMHPVVGSGDPTSEDRQLLLDAVLAASDQLIITFSGRNEFSNAPLPPAVPIAELLDEIDAMITTESGAPASELIRTEHPLQAFDPVNFTNDGLIRDRSWGFDPHMLAGARALVAPSAPTVQTLSSPFEPATDAVLALSDLVRFFAHPVKAFVGTRLEIRLPDRDDPRSDTIPIDLNHFEKWAVGDRLLSGALAGYGRADLLSTLVGSRRLPVGALAAKHIDDVVAQVDVLLAAFDNAGLSRRPPISHRVDLPLEGLPRIAGVVGSIIDDTVTRAQYSTIRPKNLLSLYIEILALAATHPETAWQAHLVGRRGRSAVDVVSLRDRSATPEQREEWGRSGLRSLVEVYVHGMTGPVPLFEKCSHLYAAGAARSAIQEEWETGYEGSSSDPYHLIAFGEALSFDQMVGLPPDPGEIGADWPTGDSRFEILAERVWYPVLSLMEEGSR